MTFHGDVNVEHLHLAGLYNGVDNDEQMMDSISFYDTNITVTGKKTFMSNVTFQTVNVISINNVNLKDYLQHVVQSSSVIHMDKRMKIDGEVWAPSLTVDSLLVEVSGDSST